MTSQAGVLLAPIVNALSDKSFLQISRFKGGPKGHQYFRSLEDASGYIEGNKNEYDIYYNVCPMQKAVNGRGTSDDADALPMLFLDLDTDNGKHSGKKPSHKEVCELLKDNDFFPHPSVVVSSGGGLHVYWHLDFSEPFINPTERKRHAALLHGVNDHFDRWHREHGYKYERLKDLARILRVPGTPNHKYEGRNVQIIFPRADTHPEDCPSYTLPFLEKFLAKKQENCLNAIDKSTAALPDIPTQEKIGIALSAAAKVPKEWGKDASGYVIKVCRQFVRAGMTDTEVIAAFRQLEKSLPEKLPKLWGDKEVLTRFHDAKNKGDAIFGEFLRDNGERGNAKKIDTEDIAKKIIAMNEHCGICTICFYEGEMFVWWRGRYKLLPSKTKADVDFVMSEMKKCYIGLSPHIVASVIAHMRCSLTVPSMPTWLKDAPSWPIGECMAMRDAIVHVPSWAGGHDFHRIEATPNYVSTDAIDCDYPDSTADCPQWSSFLGDILDRPSVRMLQQWFGYCLLPGIAHQKMLFLVGPKRSGKGTICRMLEAVVGESNTSAPKVGDFANDFGLAPLLGKRLAIVADARLSKRADQAKVVENLLSITSGDKCDVNAKFKSPVSVRMPVKLVLCSNELPSLHDTSGAVASRILFLEMKKSFLGKEVIDLADRMLEELPGVLNWAKEGWRDLEEYGRFAEPDCTQGTRQMMQELTSPVGTFFEKECVADAATQTLVSEVYERYQHWCIAHGRKASTAAQFGKDLKASQGIERARTSAGTSAGTDRPYVYVGLALRPQIAHEF